MNVRKAVILAAGYGTRLLPATKAQPKETVTLVDKPIVQYVVEEAVASGLTQVVFVIARGKGAIEDHFDRNPDLEAHLQRRGDHEMLATIRRLATMADFIYVRQHEQKGIGHAVLQARAVVGNEPFALFFPDDVILSERPAARQLLDAYEATGGSCIAVERVSDEDVPSYGIVEGDAVASGLTRATRLLEKPKQGETSSRLGVIGRYVLSPSIFEAIENTSPGAGGEIQITDALALLLDKEPIHAVAVEGERFDAGRPLGLLKAGIALGLRHPAIGSQLSKYVRETARRLEAGDGPPLSR